MTRGLSTKGRQRGQQGPLALLTRTHDDGIDCEHSTALRADIVQALVVDSLVVNAAHHANARSSNPALGDPAR